MRQLVTRRVVTAQRHHMVQTRKDEHGEAWSRMPFADVTAHVELLIDVDAIIASLGPKALLSKGGRARGLGGDVEVRVVKGTRKERRLVEESAEKAASP